MRTKSRPDVESGTNYTAGGAETTLRSEASYYGPSYMINYLWHDYRGSTMESVLINCHYPVTPTSFLLQWGAIVKKPAGLSFFQETWGLAISPAGLLYVSDRFAGTVYRFEADGTRTRFAGTGVSIGGGKGPSPARSTAKLVERISGM